MPGKIRDSEEWPDLGIPGRDRVASEFGGDDGLIQPTSKGHVLTSHESGMLMRKTNPASSEIGDVPTGTREV